MTLITNMRRRRPLSAYWPALVVAMLMLLTTMPYVYAAWTPPPDRVYTGLMLDAPDTLQYFSWMRDHRTGWLVANRMTSQPNEPALFNLLWLVLAQLQTLTGWSNAAMFQVLRVLGLATFASAAWWFAGLTSSSSRAQRWSWLLAMCGGGFGLIWVVEKYLRGLPDVRYPFDVYVAEPNTFLSLLGYPHFLVAAACMIAIFGAALRAVERDWRWWGVAAVVGLLLGLQHAYDLLTVYFVLGAWFLVLVLKRRAIPWSTFWGMLLVGIVSFPPAGYFTWLTTRDPLWQQVLKQFPNAGVWTPNPLHLLILIGLPLILTLVTWDGFRPLARRSDAELLVKVWCVCGLLLIYLPVSFQIHLLNPLQIPLALAAVAGVERVQYGWAARHTTSVRRWVLPLLVVLALPTNLYLLSWRVVELSRHTAPYYLERDDAAALEWLTRNATRRDIVLSELELGQFVAADTDAQAVLAHWAQTVDFYATTAAVEHVLAPATETVERQAILKTYGVSYVLAPHELDDPHLVPVWQSSTARIYRVGSSAVGTTLDTPGTERHVP